MAPSDEGAVREADWGREFNLSSLKIRKDYWILSLRHGAERHDTSLIRGRLS